MNLAFPYSIGMNGRTAETDDDHHIRNLIEQILFTSPGERVNRPTFGSGLQQMVFEPNSTELAAALQFTLQASLQQFLGSTVEVRHVTVAAEDNVLRVVVQYLVRGEKQPKTAQFAQEI
jgi:phage baseplate assembly protein W